MAESKKILKALTPIVGPIWSANKTNPETLFLTGSDIAATALTVFAIIAAENYFGHSTWVIPLVGYCTTKGMIVARTLNKS